MDRPAKVCNFELSSVTQQQILRLNITMDHLLLMAVLKSICNLLHKLHEHTEFKIAPYTEFIKRYIRDNMESDRGCALISEATTTLQLFVHLATGRKLQNEENT